MDQFTGNQPRQNHKSFHLNHFHTKKIIIDSAKLSHHYGAISQKSISYVVITQKNICAF